MRFCIQSLLKIEEYEGGLRQMSGEDDDMDEEEVNKPISFVPASIITNDTEGLRIESNTDCNP